MRVYGARFRPYARRAGGRTPNRSRGRVIGAETRCPRVTSVVDLMVADIIARGYVNTGVFSRADVDPVARVAEDDDRAGTARIWDQKEQY